MSSCLTSSSRSVYHAQETRWSECTRSEKQASPLPFLFARPLCLSLPPDQCVIALAPPRVIRVIRVVVITGFTDKPKPTIMPSTCPRITHTTFLPLLHRATDLTLTGTRDAICCSGLDLWLGHEDVGTVQIPACTRRPPLQTQMACCGTSGPQRRS